MYRAERIIRRREGTFATFSCLFCEFTASDRNLQVVEDMDPQTELTRPLLRNNGTPTPDDIRDSKVFFVFSFRLMSFHEFSQNFLISFRIRNEGSLFCTVQIMRYDFLSRNILACLFSRNAQFEIKIFTCDVCRRQRSMIQFQTISTYYRINKFKRSHNIKIILRTKTSTQFLNIYTGDNY